MKIGYVELKLVIVYIPAMIGFSLAFGFVAFHLFDKSPKRGWLF